LVLISYQFEVYSREHLARKTNLADNLEDIFGRQHLSGDPGIRQLDKPVRQVCCPNDDIMSR
jgi:hypothetical protein